MTGRPTQVGRVLEFDALRGLAVLLLLASHVVEVHVPAWVLGERAHAVLRQQWPWLEVLFCLAGFVLMGSLVPRLERADATGGWRARSRALATHLARRVFRFAPAVALSLALCWVLAVTLGEAPEAARVASSAKAFLLLRFNEAMVLGEPHAWNTWTLWSVTVTLQVSLAAGALFLLPGPRTRVAALVGALAAGLLLRAGVLPLGHWPEHAPVWFLTRLRGDAVVAGMLLAVWAHGRGGRQPPLRPWAVRAVALLAAGGLAAGVVALEATPLARFYTNVFMLPAAALVLAAHWGEGELLPPGVARGLAWLGTLALPAGVLAIPVSGVVLRNLAVTTPGAAAGAVVASALALFLLSHLLSRLVERPLVGLGARLTGEVARAVRWPLPRAPAWLLPAGAAVAWLFLFRAQDHGIPEYDSADYVMEGLDVWGASVRGGLGAALDVALTHRPFRPSLIGPLLVPFLTLAAGDFVRAVTYFGAVGVVALAVFTARLCRGLVPPPLAPWVVAVLLGQPFVLATVPQFLSELPFLVCATAAASELRGCLEGHARPWRTGLWLGLALCVRLDAGAMVFAGPLLVLAVSEARANGGAARALGLFSLALVPAAVQALTPAPVIVWTDVLFAIPLVIAAGDLAPRTRVPTTLRVVGAMLAVAIAWFLPARRQVVLWFEYNLGGTGRFNFDVGILESAVGRYAAEAWQTMQGTATLALAGVTVALLGAGAARHVHEALRAAVTTRLGWCWALSAAALTLSALRVRFPDPRVLTGWAWVVSVGLVIAAFRDAPRVRARRAVAMGLVALHTVGTWFLLVAPAHQPLTQALGRLTPARVWETIPRRRKVFHDFVDQLVPVLPGHRPADRPLVIGCVETSGWLNGHSLTFAAWTRGLAWRFEGPYLTRFGSWDAFVLGGLADEEVEKEIDWRAFASRVAEERRLGTGAWLGEYEEVKGIPFEYWRGLEPFAVFRRRASPP